MPPFIVTGTVTLSGTAVASTSVVVRNDNTNEYATVNTNSSGKFLYDLNSLPSQWSIGDIITCVCSYNTYEGSTSYTIIAGDGGSIFNIALIALVVDNLNYCTIQDVYDYLGTTSSSTLFTTEQVRKIGVRIEDQIERRCNSIFHDNDGSYTTVTTEYHDVRNENQRIFFVRKRPVVSMTKAEANVANESSTANWVEMTDEVKTDLETGRVDIVGVLTGYPYPGLRMVRFTYTYGHATVPEEIRQLAILMIVREIMNSALSRAVIEGRSEFTAPQAEVLNTQIEDIFERWTYDHMVNV